MYPEGIARHFRSGRPEEDEIPGVLIDGVDRDFLAGGRGVPFQGHFGSRLGAGSAGGAQDLRRKRQTGYRQNEHASDEGDCGPNTEHGKSLSVSQLGIGCLSSYASCSCLTIICSRGGDSKAQSCAVGKSALTAPRYALRIRDQAAATAPRTQTSLTFDACLLDDRPPLGELGRLQLGERLRRLPIGRRRLEGLRVELLPNLRIVHGRGGR